MDKAEATGFGVAFAGHVALLAALSLGFANAISPPVLNDPMEVAFVDEVSLESGSLSLEDPAAALGEIEGPPESAAPPPVPAEAVPEPEPLPAPPRPAPTPRPAEAARPAKPKPPAARAAAAKPAPTKLAAAKPRPATLEAAARPTGRLRGILNGVSEKESPSRASAPKAATLTPAVRSSLSAEVRRQLKPHWQQAAPTGADVELLRTELAISLARNGSISDLKVLRTTGETASNRPQVKLHQERAIKAARLAAPFQLPEEYYEEWKLLSPIGFDKRLSQ